MTFSSSSPHCDGNSYVEAEKSAYAEKSAQAEKSACWKPALTFYKSRQKCNYLKSVRAFNMK